MCVYVFRLKMDIYAKAEDSSTHKPWTEQEVLLLLEVQSLLVEVRAVCRLSVCYGAGC